MFLITSIILLSGFISMYSLEWMSEYIRFGKIYEYLGEWIYSSINIRIYSNIQIFATHWFIMFACQYYCLLTYLFPVHGSSPPWRMEWGLITDWTNINQGRGHGCRDLWNLVHISYHYPPPPPLHYPPPPPFIYPPLLLPSPSPLISTLSLSPILCYFQLLNIFKFGNLFQPSQNYLNVH